MKRIYILAILIATTLPLFSQETENVKEPKKVNENLYTVEKEDVFLFIEPMALFSYARMTLFKNAITGMKGNSINNSSFHYGWALNTGFGFPIGRDVFFKTGLGVANIGYNDDNDKSMVKTKTSLYEVTIPSLIYGNISLGRKLDGKFNLVIGAGLNIDFLCGGKATFSYLGESVESSNIEIGYRKGKYAPIDVDLVVAMGFKLYDFTVLCKMDLGIMNLNNNKSETNTISSLALSVAYDINLWKKKTKKE